MLCLIASLVIMGWAMTAQAASPARSDLTSQARYWIDSAGQSTIEEVSTLEPAAFEKLDQPRTFKLQGRRLWLQVDLPPLDARQTWFLSLDESAFTDKVVFFQAGPDQAWRTQQAGDNIPVKEWSVANRAPTFAIDPEATPGTVWLQMENNPAPLSPRIVLINGSELQVKDRWVTLVIGAYIGFVLLVMFLGWVHARLYADRAFVAYVAYVGCMLGFQVAFTGFGGLFFWGQWAWWNNAAPAVFMLWLTASGIWFVREVCSISRHHRMVDRAVIAWSLFGLGFAIVYALAANDATLRTLNLYGLLSVILSIALCLWAWRQGERYAGWLLVGFLPVHLGYPFPALRSSGYLADSWATQYAVLIGSAIEIPLLLYILHRRAKDFSENRARLRALDSTDPLTGLTITPVLRLRLRDAMRRAHRYGHTCGLLLVELSNHSEIVALEGSEAGDRALVVAASKLTRLVRDVDTVCRVASTRFAVLIEGPVKSAQLKLLAQHFVAKGLEQASTLPGDTSLRFRMVTAQLPLAALADPDTEPEEWEDQRILKYLDKSLNQLAADSRKYVVHLPQSAPTEPTPVPVPAST